MKPQFVPTYCDCRWRCHLCTWCLSIDSSSAKIESTWHYETQCNRQHFLRQNFLWIFMTNYHLRLLVVVLLNPKTEADPRCFCYLNQLSCMQNSCMQPSFLTVFLHINRLTDHLSHTATSSSSSSALLTLLFFLSFFFFSLCLLWMKMITFDYYWNSSHVYFQSRSHLLSCFDYLTLIVSSRRPDDGYRSIVCTVSDRSDLWARPGAHAECGNL